MKRLIQFLNYITIPIIILYIRWVQYRYEKITVENYYNRSNSNIHKLQLLQSIEYYYEREFDAWGKYHPSFEFSRRELKKHRKFMNWLFPRKKFKEWEVVIWHNPRAITYYHNKIFILLKGKTPFYENEIVEQLSKWRDF